MAVKLFPIVLEHAMMLSPRVKHFVFKAPPLDNFNYLAGQFITLHFEHLGIARARSYSVANAPMQNNIIEFAAGFVAGGPGTELLFNLKVGETLQCSGPYGRLILRDEVPKRYVLVATSTGVTPYRAMLLELTKLLYNHPSLNIVIMQGVSSHDDVLYREEFIEFARLNPGRVDLRLHLSRPQSTPLQDYEYSGYVQSSFTSLALNPAEDIVYLCGNANMIDESFIELKNLNFAVQQIIREKYISR